MLKRYSITLNNARSNFQSFQKFHLEQIRSWGVNIEFMDGQYHVFSGNRDVPAVDYVLDPRFAKPVRLHVLLFLLNSEPVRCLDRIEQMIQPLM